MTYNINNDILKKKHILHTLSSHKIKAVNGRDDISRAIGNKYILPKTRAYHVGML